MRKQKELLAARFSVEVIFLVAVALHQPAISGRGWILSVSVYHLGNVRPRDVLGDDTEKHHLLLIFQRCLLCNFLLCWWRCVWKNWHLAPDGEIQAACVDASSSALGWPFYLGWGKRFFVPFTNGPVFFLLNQNYNSKTREDKK